MSSYYPSFNYMGFNSFKDKHLMVVAFDPDQGETDTYLGMESIYTDKFDGSKRLDYGAKFNNVALIKISVIKANHSDFSVADVRDFLRWTTGIRQVSYLDMLVGDEIKFSFLGRVVNAYQQKMDARTVGLSIEFESVSPWAYSPLQTISYSLGDTLSINDNGVVYKGEYDTPMLSISSDGTLSNGAAGMDEGGDMFGLSDNGTVYIDNIVTIRIDNQTDDLYSFINLNTVFENVNSTYVSILNRTLNEETKITNMGINEIVTLSSGQFVASDKPAKAFGDSFNYIWPRLTPGVNYIVVQGDGAGTITFTYRYPVKIGDCAIDVGMFDGENCCGDNTDYGFISWNDIVDEPDTLAGYGIKDTYTAAEIDKKLASISVGGGGGGDVNCNCDIEIDENELNQMLADILK